jgi:hypothetical protein
MALRPNRGTRDTNHWLWNCEQTPAKAQIKDRTGERRLSNTGLDSFEHITESVNEMTDISNEDDAEFSAT